MPKRSAKAPNPKAKPAAAPIDDRRGRILAALAELRENLTHRRNLFHSVPRRGYSSNPPPQSTDLVYRVPTSGGAQVLRELSAGNLELITARLLDELIAELS